MAIEAALYSKEPSAGIQMVTVDGETEHGIHVTMTATGERRFYPYTSFYSLRFREGE